ncbi:MAG: acyl-CoA synthetase [Burkholderiaceae bacterium]
MQPQPGLSEMHVGSFALRTPDRPAIIMGNTGRIVTFAQYEAVSNQCAQLLRSHGLGRGDTVALLLENHPLYLPLAWGGLRAGLRVTTVATHLTPEEVDYIVDNSGAGVFITSAAMAHTARQLRLPGVPAANRYLLTEASDNTTCVASEMTGRPGFRDLHTAMNQQLSLPIADQSEGIEMLYSSGTTGKPKAVRKVLPDAPFGTPHPSAQLSARLYGFNEKTVYLSPAPLYHAAPFITNLRVNRFGGTSVVMEKFDPLTALALIERHAVTTSQWVPTHFVRMLRLAEKDRVRYDLSSHRVAFHAAAPCPVDIKREMLDWWGPIIHEYYAGSEGNGYCHITPAQWLEKPGSVGQAMIGNLRICDETGEEVPAGREGTVFFEGGPSFEYHGDEEKTQSSRNKKGWSTLGDVGYVDEDGYLYLTDRKAFTIISGGVNIYPQEAENVLLTHPGVVDAAVFGVPSTDFGEEVKAVVQLSDSSQAGEPMAAELIAFCRSRLSRVKCPRSVDFIDKLPREENGKLYKRKLREAYWKDHPGATPERVVR